MLSITKEDMEFGGIMALVAITFLAPVLGFISTLLFGYFDPIRKANTSWSGKRNWTLIVSCIVLAVTVASYELYAQYLLELGYRNLTIGHVFFILFFLIIIKELINFMPSHNINKRAIFTIGVNIVCMALILMFIN